MKNINASKIFNFALEAVKDFFSQTFYEKFLNENAFMKIMESNTTEKIKMNKNTHVN